MLVGLQQPGRLLLQFVSVGQRVRGVGQRLTDKLGGLSAGESNDVGDGGLAFGRGKPLFVPLRAIHEDIDDKPATVPG